MIPVCNRVKYVPEAIRSVVAAGYARSEMQICVVDNSTIPIDWMTILGPELHDRITVYSQPSHVSLSANWNTCVTEASGHLVHILHDDDWVLPGFYQHIENDADRHPAFGLFAARCFLTDDAGVILSVSSRLPKLERGANDPSELFVTNHLYCPGVVVRRSTYDSCGGFRDDLGSVVDWEMWCRIIGSSGGRVSSHVLACYRTQEDSHYSKAIRSGSNLMDIERLYALHASTFDAFPTSAAVAGLLNLARVQEATFERAGDREAAASNAAFLRVRLPFAARLRRNLRDLVRRWRR